MSLSRTLDIAATFYDYAGVAPGLTQHGKSLRPLVEGESNRDYAMMEWELLPNRVGVALSLRTVRTKTAKLMKDLRSGAAEMYDLALDPHEMQNIYDDPDHADLRVELESYLMQRPDDIAPINTPVGPG